MTWETVIGLEVHAQLSTKTKLFSSASTRFGSNANTQVNLVDLGLPGVLPVPNKEAFRKAIMFGLAVNAEINQVSFFDRKNYFYPDLPKGYQITQMTKPIVGPGSIKIKLDDYEKTINITRAHLEEDAGKSMHDVYKDKSVIDLNRAGTPLLEIVSEPEIASAKEAVAYMKALHQLVTYLNICDGNMAEGSMRCDANVSLRKEGEALGIRTEIKNINSFKFIEKAINFEIKRQTKILESGNKVVQETRLYDSVKNETRSMRSKEFANDYRYFPEPDLLPIVISDKEFKEIKDSFPELPEEKRLRFCRDFSIDENESTIIANSRNLSDFFESVIELSDPKLSANLIVGDISALLNKDNIEISDSKIKPSNFAKLIKRISDGTISKKIAKTIIEEVWMSGEDVDLIIETKGLTQIQDEALIEDIAKRVIEHNPDQVTAYKNGKDKLFGFFVGQIMKETQGKANPKSVNKILKRLLI